MRYSIIDIIFMILFILCSAADLYFLLKSDDNKNKIFKPMLMPLLTVCYILMAKNVNPLVIAALLCGFAGDTCLLEEGIWFVAGLLAFLAGHICYIISFMRAADMMSGISVTGGLLTIGVIVYLCFFITVCVIAVNKMPKAAVSPVIIYAAGLMGMSFMAYACMKMVGEIFVPAFAGSLFFIISDSMIGFDTFIKKHGAVYRFTIMLTYIIAQTLITTSWAIY